MKKIIPVLLVFVSITNMVHAQNAFSKVANTATPLGETSQRINNTPKEITAPTPPMGWNSWNNYGSDITEAEFRTQVDYVASK